MPKGQNTTEQDHRQNAVHHGKFQFPMGILDESPTCLFVKCLVCPIVHQGTSWNKNIFIQLYDWTYICGHEAEAMTSLFGPLESNTLYATIWESHFKLTSCYWWPELREHLEIHLFLFFAVILHTWISVQHRTIRLVSLCIHAIQLDVNGLTDKPNGPLLLNTHSGPTVGCEWAHR